jgi:hypothetical protein
VPSFPSSAMFWQIPPPNAPPNYLQPVPPPPVFHSQPVPPTPVRALAPPAAAATTTSTSTIGWVLAGVGAALIVGGLVYGASRQRTRSR